MKHLRNVLSLFVLCLLLLLSACTSSNQSDENSNPTQNNTTIVNDNNSQNVEQNPEQEPEPAQDTSSDDMPAYNEVLVLAEAVLNPGDTIDFFTGEVNSPAGSDLRVDVSEDENCPIGFWADMPPQQGGMLLSENSTYEVDELPPQDFEFSPDEFTTGCVEALKEGLYLYKSHTSSKEIILFRVFDITNDTVIMVYAVWAAGDPQETAEIAPSEIEVDAYAPISLFPHTRPITSISWSPDGTKLISAGDDSFVVIYDTVTWNIIEALSPSGVIENTAWSPDSNQFATVSNTKNITLWDADTYNIIMEIPDSDGFFYLDWTADGSKVAAGGDNHISIYDPSTGEQINQIITNGNIKKILWSPDNLHLAALLDEQSIVIYEINEGTQKAEYLQQDGSLTDISWSPDGTQLAIAEENTLKKWLVFESNTPTIISELIKNRLVDKIDWEPTGTLIVNASHSAPLTVWDAESGEFVVQLHQHNSSIIDMSVSPDGNYLATAGSDGMIVVQPISDYPNRYMLTGPTSHCPFDYAFQEPEREFITAPSISDQLGIFNLAVFIDPTEENIGFNEAIEILQAASDKLFERTKFSLQIRLYADISMFPDEAYDPMLADHIFNCFIQTAPVLPDGIVKFTPNTYMYDTNGTYVENSGRIDYQANFTGHHSYENMIFTFNVSYSNPENMVEEASYALVHQLMHGFGDFGELDHYEEGHCAQIMGWTAGEGSNAEDSETYFGICPYIFDRFVQSYRPGD